MGCALCYWDFLLSVLHPAACCGVGCGVMGWGVARAAAGAPASAEAAVKERLRAALLFLASNLVLFKKRCVPGSAKHKTTCL